MATSPRRFLCLTLLLGVLLALPNGGDASPRKPGIVGGYKPIPDAEDADIQDLAWYAVRQHRRETGERLTLTRVLGGQQQIAEGKNYRLVIGAAPRSGVESLYLAEVFESWKNYRELKVFQLIV
ncbi:cysteine proteinase inhibitor 8-like [Wolffia australiana]